MAANHELDGDARAELDWLAFQYVAGELSADEVERFETQLLDDAAAAEAVSQAVALGEAVVHALHVSPAELVQKAEPAAAPRRQSETVETATRPAAGRIVSVLTAACVIVAALLISFRGDALVPQDARQTRIAVLSDATNENGDVDRRAEFDSQLLETWTEARESIAALENDSLSDGITADLLETRPESSADVPDWMFVAVELSFADATGSPHRNVLEN